MRFHLLREPLCPLLFMGSHLMLKNASRLPMKYMIECARHGRL
jgi:hypothetical protein